MKSMRYLVPPDNWVVCSLESRELLKVCLMRLKGLNHVNLVDAGFVWTEPHSKRIKVKITIQKEVLNSTILEQVLVVEYVVQYQMCNDCHRREAQDFWRAVVQVRQKVSHRRTFMYLEQLLLKSKAHQNALRIKECRNGLDFYFTNKQYARQLVDFLNANVPCRIKTSQELVSHDIQNNKFHYKHSFSIELVPVSKNDLVCLPAKLSQSLGGISQIVICHSVTSFLQVVDPCTLQTADIPASVYWKSPFHSLFEHKHMKEFYVLHIENSNAKDTKKLFKGALSDAWIVPIEDLGREEKQVHCRTHLGHLLKVGDVALGFDLISANINDANFDLMETTDIPSVVLIKKSYCDKLKRHKLRNWKLQSLDREVDTTIGPNSESDYIEFMENLEEDESLRQNINVFYKTPSELPTEENNVPCIPLEEMVREMSLQD